MPVVFIQQIGAHLAYIHPLEGVDHPGFGVGAASIPSRSARLAADILRLPGHGHRRPGRRSGAARCRPAIPSARLPRDRRVAPGQTLVLVRDPRHLALCTPARRPPPPRPCRCRRPRRPIGSPPAPYRVADQPLPHPRRSALRVWGRRQRRPPPPMATQLTPHFTLEEFTLSQTASRMGIDNTPTGQELENLHSTAPHLGAGARPAHQQASADQLGLPLPGRQRSRRWQLDQRSHVGPGGRLHLSRLWRSAGHLQGPAASPGRAEDRPTDPGIFGLGTFSDCRGQALKQGVSV